MKTKGEQARGADCSDGRGKIKRREVNKSSRNFGVSPPSGRPAAGVLRTTLLEHPDGRLTVRPEQIKKMRRKKHHKNTHTALCQHELVGRVKKSLKEKEEEEEASVGLFVVVVVVAVLFTPYPLQLKG